MPLRKSIVVMPRVSANDEAGVLVAWLRRAGEQVRQGEVIGQIETTKAAVDIEADADGFLHPLIEPGATVAIGDPIALILDLYNPDEVLALTTQPFRQKRSSDFDRPVSRRAEEMIRRSGLSLAEFPGNDPIREKDVQALLKQRQLHGSASAVSLSGLVISDRSVLLFGAGDQGVVVVDCLKAGSTYTPLCFIDENTRAPELESLPIFDAALLNDLIARGVGLAHVCIGSPGPKIRIAKRLKEQGLKIVSVIHPRAIISRSATIGEGVYIGPGVVVGPSASIGDYSQVNNNATIPHHVRLGVAVRVSDGTHLAGGIRVGDRAYFGLGVTVNTDCHIGADATIVSGVSVFDSVPAGSIIRAPAIHKPSRPMAG